MRPQNDDHRSAARIEQRGYLSGDERLTAPVEQLLGLGHAGGFTGGEEDGGDHGAVLRRSGLGGVGTGA